jgi:hypothetical protein
VLALPLLLIPFVGSKAFRSVIDYTKDGYGRLREWSCDCWKEPKTSHRRGRQRPKHGRTRKREAP